MPKYGFDIFWSDEDKWYIAMSNVMSQGDCMN